MSGCSTDSHREADVFSGLFNSETSPKLMSSMYITLYAQCVTYRVLKLLVSVVQIQRHSRLSEVSRRISLQSFAIQVMNILAF